MIFATACSSSSSGGSASGADASSDAGIADAQPESGPSGSCATLPSSAKIAGTGCTSPSGMFTEVTFDTVAGTYNQTCSTPPYANQAEFDTNEGTGGGGTVIKSNEDYVLTPTCASGSISYQTTGAPKTTIVFIWTKAP